MTWHEDIDVVVFDILGTMVDEPGGIGRGIRAASAGRRRCEGRRARRGVGEPRRRAAAADGAGRRPYAVSTVVDQEAAARVAGEAGVDDADTVRSLAASAQRLEPWPDSLPGLERIASRHGRGRPLERQSLGAHPDQRTLRAALAPGTLGRGRAQLQARSRRLPARDRQRRMPARASAHGRCPCLGPSPLPRLRECGPPMSSVPSVILPVRQDSFDPWATGLDDLATTLTAT